MSDWGNDSGRFFGQRKSKPFKEEQKRGFTTTWAIDDTIVEGKSEWQCKTCKRYVKILHQKERTGECNICTICFDKDP